MMVLILGFRYIVILPLVLGTGITQPLSHMVRVSYDFGVFIGEVIPLREI